MPDPATEQAEHIFDLWRWAWVAALITGVIVWGLIFWAIVALPPQERRRVPVQTRYNLPLEIFYTIAPIIMVVVFFYHTVDTQNAVLDDERRATTPSTSSASSGSWTFNHARRAADGRRSPNRLRQAGTAHIPTLVLPVGETTEFQLRSPDVIHSFGVPGFLMKMDVIPAA